MFRSSKQAIDMAACAVPTGQAAHGTRASLKHSAPWFIALLLGSCLSLRGQEGDPQAEHARTQSAVGPTAASAGAFTEADVAAARAETLERLKPYAPASTTASGSAATTTPAASTLSAVSASAGETVVPSTSSSDPTLKKPLPTLLQDRLARLNEYDAACLALQKATHPDPSPEQQAAESRAELGRLREILSQAARAPDSLLPPLFRTQSSKATSTLASEMKDAIEATTNEQKDWKTKLETMRGEIEKWNSLEKARRNDRDNLFQRVTALTAKSREYKSAVTDALTAGERRLATERLTNFEWEWRLETLRLKVVEAQLALEGKLAHVRDLRMDVYRAHLEIAAKTLEPMQARYRVVADEQERDLTQAKANEEKKARSSDDPLERFRARSTAEMLALEAQVIRSEQALVMSPRPTYEEQKTLADRADYDFANIKELLDDGKVSRLDAVRLNNEFRRIGPERDRLIKNEMAAIEAQLQYYENTLTSVELELLQTSLHDRFEHDLSRERLPTTRWGEGEALIAELERNYRSLLRRRQRALEKLSEAASHTLVQVTRRLGILDQEYGFIRTNIFWVRDQEPIGFLTLTQGAREFNVLVKGLVRLMRETVNPKLWGQPSVEFVITAVAVLIAPFGLIRLRRALGERIKREEPAPEG